jgi:hypothetical protein
MELLKKRDFGLVINDTFLFFKTYGASFFKQYITIIGGFLLVLTALIFFAFKYYFEALFSNIGSRSSNNFDIYINNNPVMFLSIALFFLILIVLLSLIAITNPIIFIKNIAEKNEHLNSTTHIWHQLKKTKFKMFVFLIVFIVLMLPIIALVSILSNMSNFILLWLPIYFILLPIYVAVIFQSYFFYIIENKSLVISFKSGFENIKSNFWKSVGNIIVMTIVVQVVQVIITIIPYIFMAFNLFIDSNQGSIDQEDSISIITITVSAVFVLYILSSYVLNNIIIVNQGILFFSCKEQNENLNAHDLIDSIGKSEE